MLIKHFTNRMTIYFNVLDMLIKNQIDSNLNSTCIISIKKKRVSWEILSSPNRPKSKTILKQANDIAWYSNLIEDLETWSYFLFF